MTSAALPAPPTTRASSPAVARRIASLDGLRAFSILLVLLAHVRETAGFPVVPDLVASLGELGVRVFFVISGYLITTLLLAEIEKTGTVSIKGFYVRRAFRIFPAFYAFIAVVSGLSAAGLITLMPGDVAHAVTFTMNYHDARSWWVGHLWSLSVEEQFYLIWPTLLLVVGARRGLFVAAAVVIAAPAIRVIEWRFWPAARAGVGETFPTICDAIAYGCLLAGARPWLSQREGYLRFLRSPAAALLPLVALGVQQLWRHPSAHLLVGHSAIALSVVLYVDRVVRFPDQADGRLLNTRPLELVGKLSYSLYLWQQLFLNRHSRSPLCAFPLNVVLAAGAAVVSYYGIEKTFLDLRARRAHESVRGPALTAPSPTAQADPLAAAPQASGTSAPPPRCADR